MNPIDNLHTVLAATTEGRVIPPDAALWLRTGLTRYEREGVPLEDALGLGVAARTRARNAALVEAARLLGDGTESAWMLAARLRDAVARYESRRRLRAARPAHLRLPLSPHEEALERAFAANAPRMLRGRGSLYDLLLQNSPEN